jgi:hypothetical protein
MKTLSIMIALSLLTACGSNSTNTTEPSGVAAPKGTETAPPPTEDCAKLTRTDCMRSAACTLEKTASAHVPNRDGNYVCRPSEGACEEGISQFDLPGGGTDHLTTTEKAGAAERVCTDRPGCAFSTGDCYCACKGYGRTSVEDGEEAPGCLCYCAGGAPPTCKAA